MELQDEHNCFSSSSSVGRVHIFSLSFFNPDDISDMIDEAKRKTASANATAGDTMDKLNGIKKEIGKINVSPVDSTMNKVLDDVDQSGEIFNLSFLTLW